MNVWEPYLCFSHIAYVPPCSTRLPTIWQRSMKGSHWAGGIDGLIWVTLHLLSLSARLVYGHWRVFAPVPALLHCLQGLTQVKSAVVSYGGFWPTTWRTGMISFVSGVLCESSWTGMAPEVRAPLHQQQALIIPLTASNQGRLWLSRYSGLSRTRGLTLWSPERATCCSTNV